MVARQASDYRSVALLYALIGALVAPWPLIWLSELSAIRIFIVQLAVALVLTIAFSWAGRRLALVPRWIKRARAARLPRGSSWRGASRGRAAAPGF